MTTINSDKKIRRKQTRCRAIVSQEVKIATSDDPTKYIAICNAGLSTGTAEESVLEETLKYGQVNQLTMIPNKSYCFLGFSDTTEASNVFEGMHGKAKLGQNGAVIYMSYFESIPQTESCVKYELPPGAILLENFVTEEEEKVLLAAIDDNNPPSGNMKNRSVKHFGYEFIYGSNLVDPDKPLDDGIPKECDFLWQRLSESGSGVKWTEPDQLTVNQYMPGHGIPQHVDTHSPFCDPILSLSLESDVVMCFRRGNQRLSAVLPRRSLLIMAGESRYDWMHGITPRMTDVIQTSNNTLTIKARGKRTSFTFRKLRRGPCDCAFPTLCDSQQTSADTEEFLKCNARNLEETNVHSVYEKIACHFSETRHSPWPRVAEFLQSFPEGSVVFDIGCGNGKYLCINEKALQIGCDRSSGLLNICSSKQMHVFNCDCLSVPVRSWSADGVLSIAVIHHLANESRRLQSVQEMARILRPGGQGLIYVWAKNQKCNSKKSSYLRQNKALNKGKTSETEQRLRTEAETKEQSSKIGVPLPVHTNRTEFLDQDVLVPWKLKTAQENNEKETFLRFYHVFEENELELLCGKVSSIEIETSFYDQGNHCVIFRKK